MLENSAFTKSIVKNITVKDDNQCQLECFFEATCKSYNLGPPQELSGNMRHVCELSSSYHIFSPDDLVSRPGFSYHSSVVSNVSHMVVV